MKKHLLSLILVVLMFITSQAQVVLKSYPFINEGDACTGVVTDALDNLLISGKFHATPVLFSPTSIIRKLAPDGTLLWSGDVASGLGSAWDICNDASGNSYVVGQCYSPFQLSGGPVLSGPTYGNVFMAKYSANGQLQWSKIAIPGSPVSFSTYAVGIDCDANGNVTIGGYTNDPLVDFGNGNIISGSGQWNDYTGFAAHYSTNGDIVWAKEVGGKVLGVDVAPTGEIHLSGWYKTPLAIGDSTFANTTGGMFVAKVDQASNPLWVRTSVSAPSFGAGPIPNSTRGNAVASDITGAVYVTGHFYRPTTWEGIGFSGGGAFGGAFIVKYNVTGGLEWVKSIMSYNHLTGFEPSALEVDANGSCYIAAEFASPVYLGNTTFNQPAGNSYDDLLYTKFNPLGDFMWGIIGSRGLPNHNVREVPSKIALNSAGYSFLSGSFHSTANVNGVLTTFGNHTSNENGGFLYKLGPADNVNLVTGKIYYDFNSNGSKDSTEPYAGGIIAQAQPSQLLAHSMLDGTYNTYVDSGNFSLTIPSPPLYYTAAPTVQAGLFSGVGGADSTRHFALQPMPGMQDLRVTATSCGPPRPGFIFPITITYKNVGTVAISGTVMVTLDSLLALNAIYPAATTQNGNSLTFNFGSLQPLQSASIYISTLVPSNAVLGTLVTNNINIQPSVGTDLTPLDNSTQHQRTVVGSYDPNDKQVSQTTLTPTEVAAGKYLEYTIRFQNTGTDTAFTVRLLDTLDAQLNIPTFEMLASSHPNTWSIKGNGILEWRFDNILLPDSNTNEAASHGFVKYRIRPNTSLPLGSIVRNTAAIYFDFNAPVITNTATTEVALISGVNQTKKQQLHIYPNPNKGSFTVALQNVQEQRVKAELRNVLGQVVWQQNLAAENGNVQQQVNTTGLSKGIYFLQVNTGKGTAVQKVVIE